MGSEESGTSSRVRAVFASTGEILGNMRLTGKRDILSGSEHLCVAPVGSV